MRHPPLRADAQNEMKRCKLNAAAVEIQKATCAASQDHIFRQLAGPHHLVSANILHLLLAIDDCTVHTHGLIHKAKSSTIVEAISWAVVDAVGLIWEGEVQHPWVLPCTITSTFKGCRLVYHSLWKEGKAIYVP